MSGVACTVDVVDSTHPPRLDKGTGLRVYIYIYIYICVCVCVAAAATFDSLIITIKGIAAGMQNTG